LDLENQDGEDKKRTAFSVVVLQAHKMPYNNETEFIIQVDYQEGEGSKWNIYKTLTEIKELQTTLASKVSEESSQRIPVFPSLSSNSLELRK
jgi:hypothetical protein